MKVYFDFFETLSALEDAECGRLFRAMLRYSATGEAPELTGNERFLWPAAKVQIDRAQANYRDVSEKRALAGQKGADAKKQLPANDSNCLQEKEEEKEEDKEKEKKKKRRDADFEAFWDAYPRHVGKDKARTAYNKVTVPVENIVAAIERQKHSLEWTLDNGKYVPYPATWINRGGWEDELTYPEIVEQPKQKVEYRRTVNADGETIVEAIHAVIGP